MMGAPSSVTLATRGSALALVQSRAVERALRRTWPGLEVTTRVVRTAGDRDRHSPLAGATAEGWFTSALEQALLDGQADLAVHSLKDLPTSLPDGLALLGCLERGDVRDLLVFAPGHEVRRPVVRAGDVVGTGSPRRRAEIARRFPGTRFAPIRGNVGTRLEKLCDEPGFRATMLAAAGLARLGLFDGARIVDERNRAYPFVPFEPPDCLPAAGQAVIGIEGRVDAGLRELIAAAGNVDASRCAAAERSCLAALGAGCRVPAGVLAVPDSAGDGLRLSARVMGVEGEPVVETTVAGTEPERVGRQAGEQLLANGAERILEAIR
jgi:hydroxymethylbilane synthase